MGEWFWKKVSFVSSWIAILIFFIVVIIATNLEIKDLDLWLHLGTGKYIVEHFEIPKTDILSCTIAGAQWINHEWLFQVFVYLLNKNFGIDGLISMQVIVVCITFVLLLLSGYDKDKMLWQIFILLLVLLVYQIRFTIRPEIFSLLFLTLYIHILALFLEKKSSLWIIFFIQVIWANIHGFFILGPALIFIGLIAELIKRKCRLPFEWNNIGRLNDDEYKNLKIIFILSVLACFVNPCGIKGVWYPISVLFSLGQESKVFFGSIQELQKPIILSNIFSPSVYPYYKLLIIVSFISLILNFKKVDVSAILLWVFFLLFSLVAIRNIVFFAFIAYFVFLTNLRYLSFESIFHLKMQNKNLKTVLSTVFKILIIFWMLNYLKTLSYRGYYDFDKLKRKSEYGGISLRNFPYKAVDFLKDNNVKGNFFNDFNSGAYIIGRTSPNIKVFIDGRTEVYGSKFYNKYNKIWKGDYKLFEKAVKDYNLTGVFLNHVYVPAPGKIQRYLYKNKKWLLVYFDYDATIYLKDIPKNKNIIDKYAITLSDWESDKVNLFDYGLHKITPYQHINRAYVLYNLRLYDQALKEVNKALKISSTYDDAYKLKGKILNREKEYVKAFENLRKAKLLNPRDVETRYEVALSYYYLGYVNEANIQNLKALGKYPENAPVLYLQSLILIEENRYNESFELLKKAVDISPDFEDIVEVGDLLYEQNNFNLAKKVYELAIKADPDNIKVKNILSKIENK